MKRILLFPSRLTQLLSSNDYRVFKIILMIFVFITALYTKEYRGTYQSLINNNLGGLFYVFFGSLLFSIIMPRLKPLWPVTIAFVLTGILEYLQYLKIPLLQSLSEQKVFAYLFGAHYNPADFFWYGAGALVAVGVLSMLRIEKPRVYESIDPLGEYEHYRIEQTENSVPETQLERSTVS